MVSKIKYRCMKNANKNSLLYLNIHIINKTYNSVTCKLNCI